MQSRKRKMDDVVVLSDSESRTSSPAQENSDSEESNYDFPSFNVPYKMSNNESRTSLPSCSKDTSYSSSAAEVPMSKDERPKKASKKTDSEKSPIQTCSSIFNTNKPTIQKQTKPLTDKQKNAKEDKLLKKLAKLNQEANSSEGAVLNCYAIIDEGYFIKDNDYTQVICENMQGLVYKKEKNEINMSVIWQRITQFYYLDCDEEEPKIECTEFATEEKYILILLTASDFVLMIARKKLEQWIEKVKTSTEKETISLLIHGMDQYYSQKHEDLNSSIRTESYRYSKEVSKMKLEETLVKIQLLYGISVQFVESKEAVGLAISQFTKAIALKPEKEKKWKNLGDVDSYIAGEKRDLVAVSKNGYGLKQLWLKQLCQLNLCSLEIAEAICSVYPSPMKLMKAYEQCSTTEGEVLLKDIPIRRTAGASAYSRKVGIELSKKIYLMFTAEDGDILL